MIISKDQRLEVFLDSFHSFYSFGIQKCKNQRFFCEKIIFGAILSNRSACVLRKGPGDLKNTPIIWNLIYGRFFTHFKKKMEKKSHFARILKNVSSQY